MLKFKKIILSVSLVAAASVIATSCYKDREELLYRPDCSNPTKTPGPKFTAVQSIIQSECISCHSSGGTSPDLSTACNVVDEADGIYNECVVRKVMPQAAPLSQSNQDAITSWYNAGHKYTD